MYTSRMDMYIIKDDEGLDLQFKGEVLGEFDLSNGSIVRKYEIYLTATGKFVISFRQTGDIWGESNRAWIFSDAKRLIAFIDDEEDVPSPSIFKTALMNAHEKRPDLVPLPFRSV